MIGRAAREGIVAELVSLRGAGRQVEPFSRRHPGFGLDDACAIATRLRDLRAAAGETAVGRKIGFTNRAIWKSRGLSAPIWNYVFDTTVTQTGTAEAVADLTGMPEPRIEPEVVLHLGAAPAPGMTAQELAACIDWGAPGFEVVYSVFPGWEFAPADAAAAFGVHGALFIGERLDAGALGPAPAARLSALGAVLESDRGIRREGRGGDVLGGPIEALGFLVAELARLSAEPLRAGEVVTTGTLTEAMPMRPGERWSARFEGIPFAPLRLRVA